MAISKCTVVLPWHFKYITHKLILKLLIFGFLFTNLLTSDGAAAAVLAFQCIWENNILNELMKNSKQSNLESYSLGLFRQLKLYGPDVIPMMSVIYIKQICGAVVFFQEHLIVLISSAQSCLQKIMTCLLKFLLALTNYWQRRSCISWMHCQAKLKEGHMKCSA